MVSRRDVLSVGGLMGLGSAARQGRAASAGTDERVSLWSARIAPGMHYLSGVTRALDADLGFIDVPADHGAPHLAIYRLRFARFRSRSGGGLPLFFLYGGPHAQGDLWNYLDAGEDQWAFTSLVATVTEHADLVVIDHRGGLGCVYPKLPAVPLAEPMPFDRRLGLDEREDHYRRFFQKQIGYWGDAGVDLRHMRTPQLARDIEMLRRALGYDKIRLSGMSNGTYRAREYLRQFPDRVDSALLFIAHGYQKLPFQEFVGAALSRIDAAVAADPDACRFVPSLRGLLEELTTRLDRSPVKATASKGGEVIALELDHHDLVVYFWHLFGANDDIRAAPAKLWSLYKKGDYTELARVALQARDLGSQGAEAYIAAFAGSSMPSAAEVAANRRHAGSSIYLNRQGEGGESSCAWPLDRDSHVAFAHRVPVTYVQGEWDLRTPLEAVKAIGETTAAILVNPAMGHQGFIDRRAAPDGTGVFWPREIFDAFLTGGTPAPYTAFARSFASPLFGT
jgi:pimeloyl-ACP methyl ester carboxylesterase